MDLDLVRGIDRKTPLPYYYQLKQILLEAVEDQRLRSGDLLPGDHELALHFGLSRGVVRQALAELETEGLITRRRGKGTFLTREKVSEGLASWVGGLADDARRRGVVVRSRVLRNEVVAADSRVAHILSLEEGAPVVMFERVRSLDDEPWVHTIAWLPVELFPGLENEDLSTQSLYDVLRERYDVSFGQVNRSVEASPASDETAEYIGIEAGDPVLRLSSLLFDASGRAIETFVAFHRVDRSRFDVQLRADDSSHGAPVAIRAAVNPI